MVSATRNCYIKYPHTETDRFIHSGVDACNSVRYDTMFHFLRKNVRIPVWKLMTYFCITTVLVYMLQYRVRINVLKVRSNIVVEETPEIPTTTADVTTATTTNPANAFYNKSAYNYTYYLTHAHDVNFVELHKMLEKGGKIDLEVVNPHPFEYISYPSTVCDDLKVDNTTSSVLILIKSEPGNFHLRQSIRWFWETQKKYHEYVRIVFLLGVSNTEKNTDVMIEQARYDDVVQQNFIDVYKNLTYKTIMGFNWAVQNCNGAKHILFQDDDFRINMENLMKLLNSHKNPDSIFLGALRLKSPTVRTKHSRYYVSNEVYPHKVYPPFLVGDSFLISMNIVRKLVSIFPYVKRLPMADTYLGMVAFKLDITLQDGKEISFKNCNNMKKIIACRGFTSFKEILGEWKTFVNRAIMKLNFR